MPYIFRFYQGPLIVNGMILNQFGSIHIWCQVYGVISNENVNPTDIHRRFKAVYGNQTIDRSTVSRWVTKCKLSDPGKINILDKHRDGQPITVMDEKH